MKLRLLFAAATLVVLGGCATYDYTGGSSGYYRGTDSVRYNYPAGYSGGSYYGGGYYGSYPFYGYGLYGTPGYRVYRGHPIYRQPPPHQVHRPGRGDNHRPPQHTGPRPGHGPRPNRPPRPNTPRPAQRSPSPWRDLNGLKQSGPRQNRGGHPPRRR